MDTTNEDANDRGELVADEQPQPDLILGDLAPGDLRFAELQPADADADERTQED